MKEKIIKAALTSCFDDEVAEKLLKVVRLCPNPENSALFLIDELEEPELNETPAFATPDKTYKLLELDLLKGYYDQVKYSVSYKETFYFRNEKERDRWLNNSGIYEKSSIKTSEYTIECSKTVTEVRYTSIEDWNGKVK